MVFSSAVFLLAFFPLLFVLYYQPFFKSRTYRNTILLIASLVFYAWGEPVFIFVMLIWIVINWLIAKTMTYSKSRKGKKASLILAIILDVGLIFIFKYLGFALKNIKLLFGVELPEANIALPIGISFFVFQIMSYVIDVYRGKTLVQNNLFKLALYISFFPQLIAGPIVRYQTIALQLDNRDESMDNVVQGFCRFTVGLGKKMILANYLARIADNIFAMVGGEVSVLTMWLGAVAYMFQIYFDFSGYSDMAIGLGRIFGFRFEENFNYPYICSSITDFWRRWHISLSVWFRDYLYIPLGGNRCGKGRRVINLFVVWLLTGLWHGANWTFILWGLWYFILLTIEKLSGFDKKKKWYGHLYSLSFVLIGWVIFRADSVSDAIWYIGSMFGANAQSLTDSLFVNYISDSWIVFTLALMFSLPIAKIIRNRAEKMPNGIIIRCFDLLQGMAVLGVFLLCVCLCVKSTYNPFIYFNF